MQCAVPFAVRALPGLLWQHDALWNPHAAMLYDSPTWEIVLVLGALMGAANEVGFRFGRLRRDYDSESFRSVGGLLKGSLFGLTALLLGFSFSATTARYDLRQRTVLDQANAIGTCYLRAGLLDPESRDPVRSALQQHVEQRLSLSAAGSDARAQTAAEREIEHTLRALWTGVEAANQRDPQRTRFSFIVPAANEVIDLSATRAWANRNHLPSPVLVLLLTCVVVSSAMCGHSSGQTGQRHAGVWLATNVVFALVLFVVLDFDRPRRGLIRVDQTALAELQASLQSGSP